MLNLTYISDADRARLVELNEAVRSCTTIEEQRKIREEIVELEGKRKPLHECTLMEITELRTFVWDKFQKLNGAGKYHLAQQFKVMLQQIEIRQAVLNREMAVKEAERLTNKAQGKQPKKVAKSEAPSQVKTKSGNTSSRWTTGIGDLD